MKIVILGNGISGVTAARFIRKHSDHDIRIISSESEYFFSRTALMYIYMGHMRLKDTQPYENDFWTLNNIELTRAHIQKIDFEKQVLHTDSDTQIPYDRLVLAVGSKSNKFGWPGQDLDGVHGLYSLQDLEAMERHSEGLERAVIVGGGLIGIEMAEMFLSRQKKVSLLVREASYWNNVLPKEESEMVNRHARQHGVDLQLSTELDSIHADDQGKVQYIMTKDNRRIDCQFVGLTAGVSPNVDFLKNTSLEIEKGILVNQYLETNVPNVFAIGDCAQIRNPQPGRRSIEAVWYAGRMMGEVAAYNVLGQKIEYDPGIWFNSAKFFDIEYQVYGNVPSTAEEPLTSVFWQSDDGLKSIRIVYDSQSEEVKGFNLMGVRFRQEVCEKWIRNKTLVGEVVRNLSLAAFDPEFYPPVWANVRFKHGEVTKPKRKYGLNRIIEFIKS